MTGTAEDSGATPVDIDGDDGAETDSARRPHARSRSLVPTVVVAAAVVVLDQLTKHWAVNRLSDGSTIDVIASLRFNLTFNSGMAFGRGQGFGPVIGVIALVVVTVLLVGLRREGSRLGDIAAGLVIGGAIGNIVDRLFRGEGWFRGSVVDFIDVQWWPVFNVADMGVTIGGVLLVISSLMGGRADAARAASSPTGPAGPAA